MEPTQRSLKIGLILFMTAAMLVQDPRIAIAGFPADSVASCKPGTAEHKAMLEHFPPQELNAWMIEKDGECPSCLNAPKKQIDPNTGYLVIDGGSATVLGKSMKNIGVAFKDQIVGLFKTAVSGAKVAGTVCDEWLTYATSGGKNNQVGNGLRRKKVELKKSAFSVISEADMVKEVASYCNGAAKKVPTLELDNAEFVFRQFELCQTMGHVFPQASVNQVNQYFKKRDFKSPLQIDPKSRVSLSTVELIKRYRNFESFDPELKRGQIENAVNGFDQMLMAAVTTQAVENSVSTFKGFKCLPSPFRAMVEGKVGGNLINPFAALSALKWMKMARLGKFAKAEKLVATTSEASTIQKAATAEQAIARTAAPRTTRLPAANKAMLAYQERKLESVIQAAAKETYPSAGHAFEGAFQKLSPEMQSFVMDNPAAMEKLTKRTQQSFARQPASSVRTKAGTAQVSKPATSSPPQAPSPKTAPPKTPKGIISAESPPVPSRSLGQGIEYSTQGGDAFPLSGARGSKFDGFHDVATSHGPALTAYEQDLAHLEKLSKQPNSAVTTKMIEQKVEALAVRSQEITTASAVASRESSEFAFALKGVMQKPVPNSKNPLSVLSQVDTPQEIVVKFKQSPTTFIHGEKLALVEIERLDEGAKAVRKVTVPLSDGQSILDLKKLNQEIPLSQGESIVDVKTRLLAKTEASLEASAKASQEVSSKAQVTTEALEKIKNSEQLRIKSAKDAGQLFKGLLDRASELIR